LINNRDSFCVLHYQKVWSNYWSNVTELTINSVSVNALNDLFCLSVKQIESILVKLSKHESVLVNSMSTENGFSEIYFFCVFCNTECTIILSSWLNEVKNDSTVFTAEAKLIWSFGGKYRINSIFFGSHSSMHDLEGIFVDDFKWTWKFSKTQISLSQFKYEANSILCFKKLICTKIH
jgi:hypothetical protein